MIKLFPSGVLYILPWVKLGSVFWEIEACEPLFVFVSRCVVEECQQWS